MITGYFYKFSKKVNSTKRPTGSGTTIEFTFKGNDSIVAPSILLNGVAIDYDYVYIPSLKRYYFVSNIVLMTNNIKEYSLTIDVLATYKTEILASNKYVLRSASHPNQYISDPVWTHNSNYAETHQTHNLPSFDSTGCYIITVVNGVGLGTANPASTMYVCNELTLYFLLKDMFDSANYSNISDFDLTATFFNPFQYITSCRWYPLAVASVSEETAQRIKYGWYTANNLTALGRPVTDYGKRLTTQLTIGTYSDWTDRDNNWTRYSLYVPGCGMLDIDAAYSGKTVDVNYDIDYNTGNVFCTLTDGNNSQIIAQTSGQIGAEVSINQIAGNIQTPGDLKSALSMGAQFAGGFLAKGGAGAIGNAIAHYQKIQGAVLTRDYAAAGQYMQQDVNAGRDAAGAISESLMQTVLNPTVSKSGADGCRNTILRNHYFRLYKRQYQRYSNAESELGGQCQSMRTLSTLSGYTKCANGVIDIGGTLEEKNGITTFLENGFFIE